MTALAPLAPKLARLILRLATDHDGEVIATVRAIERTLRRAGLDLHDLAQALEREPEPKAVIVDRNRDGGEPQTWAGIARWCRNHGRGRLKAHERTFVNDMAAQLVLGGEPTPKQAAWLRSIFARLRRGLRP